MPIKIDAMGRDMEFDGWGWGQAPRDMIDAISRNAAKLVLEDILKTISGDDPSIMPDGNGGFMLSVRIMGEIYAEIDILAALQEMSADAYDEGRVSEFARRLRAIADALDRNA
jgi:hypothetical protein